MFIKPFNKLKKKNPCVFGNFLRKTMLILVYFEHETNGWSKFPGADLGQSALVP